MQNRSADGRVYSQYHLAMSDKFGGGAARSFATTSAAPKVPTVSRSGGAQGRPRGGDLVSATVTSSSTVLSALTLPPFFNDLTIYVLFKCFSIVAITIYCKL